MIKNSGKQMYAYWADGMIGGNRRRWRVRNGNWFGGRGSKGGCDLKRELCIAAGFYFPVVLGRGLVNVRGWFA
jgi:hypothetical protein